jgi:UDP-N-acetylmuramate dehydrogenase
MTGLEEALRRLAEIPLLQVTPNEPLWKHTRFGLGGAAEVFACTEDEAAFVEAVRRARASGAPWVVIGMGTNLLVADEGFPGIVLRYDGARIQVEGSRVTAQAGAALQAVVDAAIDAGLQGYEPMTGIPGNLGAAIYGNAGAYGASVSDRVVRVRYFDGLEIRETDHSGCGFRYRESEFKRRRLQGEPWLILSAEFEFPPGNAAEMRRKAEEILAVRSRKYPPEMKCAGSIFKNLLLERLPEAARAAVPPGVVKGGKVPAAWFLEQAGAKGMARGGIRVSEDHANTLYNAGGGTAAEFRALAEELKRRVRERFGVELEEEVQYIGFGEGYLP